MTMREKHTEMLEGLLEDILKYKGYDHKAPTNFVDAILMLINEIEKRTPPDNKNS